MKREIILFLIAASMSLLCACGSDSVPAADSKGNQIYYTSEDLQITSLEGTEGFFVKNKDGSFSPVISAFTGYAGESEEASAQRYLWFTENDQELIKLIPVVRPGAQLVMLYNKDTSIPEEFQLEKYAYKGYTIGCHVFRDEDDSMYIKTTDALAGSHAAEGMNLVADEDQYKVSTVNGSDQLPIGNIDNNMQLLLGLEKGKQYNFSFYKGTRYITFTTVADAQVFQSERIIKLNAPYERTTDGYFTITLPDNLQNGFYYICGLGMFAYQQ